MALQDDIKPIIEELKSVAKPQVKIQSNLFDIYEGNLKAHVDQWLSTQMSPKSYQMARKRIAPINVLKKLVDKLSQIYQQAPLRRVADGSESDDMLLEWYDSSFKTNQNMNVANEFFNMARSTLVQPYLHDGMPKLRAIPNDRFWVWSDDKVDPTNPTHVVTFQGDIGALEMGLYSDFKMHVYTDEEYLIVDSRGNVLSKEMQALGNFDGENPYGKIPFVYINRSANLLIPPADVDTLCMTLLIPGLLTDLNYASMFSLFSIMYGINLKDENLELAPNAFWRFMSDPDNEQKPEIGQIKPEADVQETLELIRSQLAFWLNTRSIKAGAIGDMEGSNLASGISKLIDEADTTEERKKQVEYFSNAEEELWDLVFQHMHPYWVKTNQIENRAIFSPSAYVETVFAEQIPLMNRGELIRDLKDEVDAGFSSKRRAIQKLNPRMTEDEIDQLIKEIDEEDALILPEFSTPGLPQPQPEEEDE